MPLTTRGEFLCIDTRLFNALNHSGIHFMWDYKNKGLKFENNSDYRRAMELKQQIEGADDEINQEIITDKPNIISNVPKEKSNKEQIKKSRLF